MCPRGSLAEAVGPVASLIRTRLQNIAHHALFRQETRRAFVDGDAEDVRPRRPHAREHLDCEGAFTAAHNKLAIWGMVATAGSLTASQASQARAIRRRERSPSPSPSHSPHVSTSGLGVLRASSLDFCDRSIWSHVARRTPISSVGRESRARKRQTTELQFM
jgi:hypothetical protein